MKKILSLLIVFCVFGCKKYVVTFEQPTDAKLNNLKLEIILDKKKVKDIILKSADGMPTYETTALSISDDGKHQLQIKAKDTTFSYDLNFPEEKYILVTAHLKNNGKVHVGILKQQYKFRFQ